MEMGIWYKENVLQGRGLQQSVQPKAGDVAVMKSRLWSCAAGRLLNVGLVCLTWFEMQLGSCWGSTGNLPQCSRVVLHSTEQNQHFRTESAWPNCAGDVRRRSESSVWVTCAAHAGVWSKCEEGACVSHLLVSPKIWNEELLCCSDCSFNGKQMSVLTDAW